MTMPPRAVAPLSALLLGLVSACGFQPFAAWPATLVCIGVLAHLLRREAHIGRALLLGWAFGLGHFTLGLNWIATAFTFQAKMPGWLGGIAVVLLSIYLAVYPALATLAAWRFGRHNGPTFALLLGAGWIVTEWLRATMFTGFAWNPLSAIWAGGPLAFPTRLIGTYGLSGLTVAAAAMAQPTWHMLRRAAAGQRAPTSAMLAILSPFALLFALTLSLRTPPLPPTPKVIRVVQPNINQNEKYDEDLHRRNAARLAALSGRPGPTPRLLLWPEAATPAFLEQEPLARLAIAELLGPRDMLLLGGDALEYDRAGELVGARNSTFLLNAGARLLGRYDKAHLVPYGEYLPMRGLLEPIGLARLVPGDIDFWSGPGPATIAVPGFGRVGLQLCYEIIFSGAVVDRAHRPDVIFNPSNDAWFGRWGPPQHLAQARLRAVEEGLPVLRSTPTGISAVVDADGRLVASVPWHQAGAIETRLPAPRAPTPFAQIGNLAALLFAGLLAALAIATRPAPRYKRT